MNTALKYLLPVLCAFLLASCLFCSHKDITAPCTRKLSTPRTEGYDDSKVSVYLADDGNLYAEIVTRELCKSWWREGTCYVFLVVSPIDFECWHREISPPERGWVRLQAERELKLDKNRRTASIDSPPGEEFPITRFKILSRCAKPEGGLIPVEYAGRAEFGESEPYGVACAAWRKPVAAVDAVLVDAPMTVVTNVMGIPFAISTGIYLLFGGEMW